MITAAIIARRSAFIAVAILSSASCAAHVSVPKPCCDSSFIHFGAPLGWSSIASPGQRDGIGVFDAGVHGGRYSAAIVTWDTTAAGTGMAQIVSAEKYRGKRIRLSAWLKGTSNTNRDNVLWLRVADRHDGSAWSAAALDSAAPSRENAFGLSPWQMRQIVIDVPADATAIGFGVLLTDGPFEPDLGPGPHELFADDFRLDMVDTRTMLSGTRSDVIEEFARRLNFAEPAPAAKNLDFELMK